MNLKKKTGISSVECRRIYAGDFVIVFCLALIVLISAVLKAQETAPIKLSLDEAVELAVRNNLSLESSRVGLETKRRASDLSWNQFIPQVTVSGTFNMDNKQSDPVTASMVVPLEKLPGMSGIPGLSGTQVAMEGVTGNFYNPGTFGLFVSDPVSVSQWRPVGNISVSLSFNMAMIENMNRLRIEYESGLLSYEKAKAQLERDVRKAYHSMLLLQENIELMRGSYANVERQVQMAQANYNAGLAPELTLLQARVALENMRPVIDQVENGMRLSMAQFAFFLGMEYNTRFDLVPISEGFDFIPLDVADMISQAARGKPDIQELRNTILMLESARKISVYSLTPSLNLSWNSTSAFVKDPAKDNWFTYDNWRHSGSLSITVALRVHSLLPWSTDTQAIRNLDDQLRTATIGLAQMIRGTEIEVYNIVLSLERTRANTQALEQTVALAEQSYRLTEQAYRAGLQDYFQVQNAEQSLHQARVQLLEQHFTYLNSLIDLEYAVGVPFGTLSQRSR
ncbi:MAG: TolC family protein [Treponema sp.]|nr:TolC family protein [Treponema sp.]